MSEEKDGPKDIEVPDAPKEESAAAPTLSELADAGFAPQEVEMAKKHGLAKAEGDKDGDPGDARGRDTDEADKGGEADEAGTPGDEKKGEESADKGGSDGKKVEAKKTQKTVDERYRILAEGRSPETIMQEIQDQGIELSPEQEKILIAGLTNNGRTLYWAQKKAKLRAQKAEADALERTKELTEARAEIAELKKRPAKTATTEEDPLNLEGEEAPAADPKKKSLTMEDLERIDAEKQAKVDEDEKKRMAHAEEIRLVLDDQQAEARERYEDFDQSLELVGDILTRANAGTLKELYPDSRQQTRIILRARTLLNAFANADKFGSDQFNAADMAYELGKEHPEYGKKKPDAKGTTHGETDVDGNPEDARRAVNNASRRGSSATLNGGGSRRVALDELTLEQARRLPDAQYRKLPKAIREKLLAS